MYVDTESMVTMTEANQNFSRVAKLVDKKGSVVILKNNEPRYVLMDFSKAEGIRAAEDDSVIAISSRLIEKNRQAYEELAK